MALFELILIYFGLFVVVFSELLRLSWNLAASPWEIRPAMMLRIAMLAASIIVGVQIARRFWRGIVGLVTNRYDRAPEAQVGVLLDREENAALYELVAEVGKLVDSPSPDEIRISHEPECFVAELRSFGVRTRRRLILVLGMPHLAVLNVSELSVILAHELAHFTGGDTTLGVFDYRFIETLRRALFEMRRTTVYWASPVYWYCRAFHRLFLFLSGPVQRYQELRADCLSAAAFGGKLAIDTLLNEWLLARQFEAAVVTFPMDAHGAPADDDQDVYTWFASQWRQFSLAGHDYLRRRLAEEERPSILDSHPTIQARIETMQYYPPRDLEDTRPVLQLISQATALASQLHQVVFSRTGDDIWPDSVANSPRNSYSCPLPSDGRLLDRLAIANILKFRTQSPAITETCG
ncbi:MAG: M48 family metallopeptidase [Planctomycetales bacterium]|nr:M48 family metallopeptidase [Planctomycetales bacterium]